jgi:predicted alpha/beta superfamily hydrolase
MYKLVSLVRTITLTVVLFFIIVVAVTAQDKVPARLSTAPFVMGVTDQIHSVVLGENRVLNIYLPEGYDKDTAHYPVIYLLDGSKDEDFIHIAGLVQFLTMLQSMPNTIIIGIGNVDRRRDFTAPTSIDSDRVHYPTTGHSNKFISFVEQELQPYVQQNYRTNGAKTIIGQSLGGLLATEILFTKPQLFSNYMIISPSLWWDNESLLKIAPSYIKAFPPAMHINVYVAVGTEGKQMQDDALTLADALKKFGGKELRVYFSPFPQESHLTILHRAVYKGFEWLNGTK